MRGPDRQPPLSEPVPSRSAAVERLFREHNQALIRFLMTRLGSEPEAREVAQEAYVRLLQLDQPGAIGFLRQFLFKTALNIAIDRLRHRQTVLNTAGARQQWFDLGASTPMDDQLAAQQETKIIEAALGELQPRCREAFLLSRLGGIGTREIAHRMKVSERMVRMYLAKATLHCRQRLDEANAVVSRMGTIRKEPS